MTEELNKAGLIASIHRERAALEQILANLSPEQMSQAELPGDGRATWSVKDLLAHLTWWEQRMLTWLPVQRLEELPSLPAIGADNEETLALTNEYIYKANKNRSVEEIVAAYHRSFKQIVVAVEAIPEEQLPKPRPFDLEGDFLVDYISGNTFEHYKEHREVIEHWLEGKTK